MAKVLWNLKTNRCALLIGEGQRFVFFMVGMIELSSLLPPTLVLFARPMADMLRWGRNRRPDGAK
ncbi:hypothetical protein [Paenibacillus sp. J2TS4]|uniref:hypothetical protein n=1 Tax=Paenibacillus sp. J2TS4 TaxID=2807194 RepID=UPI001BD0CCB6|nr:hypothetical protein [Paenibacillus sp. J2TS4]